MNEDRARVIRERVELALEQLKSAEAHQLRGILFYWFGVMFDEGMQMASRVDSPTLKMMTEKLREMNEKLKRALDDE